MIITYSQIKSLLFLELFPLYLLYSYLAWTTVLLENIEHVFIAWIFIKEVNQNC